MARASRTSRSTTSARSEHGVAVVDTFEAVRIEAARVHDATVAAGADPLDPLRLVEAAIGSREIELTWLKPGDTYLRGGRGLYDPHLEAIACENGGQPAERALLAGHELGHAVLHDPGEIIVDRHVDPARAAEGAASGVEKVADYGRVERRELQADLFARELVLPRTLARRLYLEDRRWASAIAALTGLPSPLLGQQLLDALLLPAYAPSVAPAGRPTPPLDPSQRRAALHAGTPFLLQAGPGTGKTRTLISRIEHLVDGGVPATEILVLTFSNKAAGELVERLTASRPDAASAAWIGTFHGFGLDILRRFHDREGLSDNPRLIDRADAVGLLEDLVPRLPLRHYRNLHDPTLELGEILRAISRAKDELVGPDRYLELAGRMEAAAASGNEEDQIRAAKAIEVAEAYRVYDIEMRRIGLLDFGDLVMRPALLLERDAEAREMLRLKHRHILVDEYQDVNRGSVRLLKALAGPGERLWVVGDSRQYIYRSRGASSANMAGFRADFPGGTLDRLTVNYRSSDEVVATFSHFADGMSASRGVLPLQLRSDAGACGERPELRTVTHPEDEAAAVAARILELRDAGTAFRNQVVLCRGNARLGDVAAELERRDVPVLFLGNLFEREEVRDLLALLTLLVDAKGSSLARVAAMPRYALRLDDLGRLKDILGKSRAPLGWLAEAIELLGPAAAGGLRSLTDDLADFGPSSPPWTVLCHLLLDLGRVRDLVGSGRISDRMRCVAIWQLMLFCQDLPDGPGLPIQRLLDRARRLVLLSEERDLRQMPAAAATMDGVHLMTVHGSKGLEFDAVHVPGMVVRSFPGDNRPPRCPPADGLISGSEGLTGIEAVRAGHDEEEECLFFVALSRARRHLSLYAASQMANGNNRGRSPFLGRIESRTTLQGAPVLFRPMRIDAAAHKVDVAWSTPPLFTAEQLSLYAKCPRRFFYTYVLGVAGGRRSTAFVQMHDVVYEMMRWLRAEPARWHLPQREVEARFDAVWSERGPTEHGYASDYRRAALGLVEALMRSRAGHAPGERLPVEIPMDGLRILVEPDEDRGTGGATTLRRVRSGRKTAKEDEDIVYALYQLAAQIRHGPGARVEAIHLSEDTVTPIEIGPRKMANREGKLRTIAANILAGHFPPDHDERTCPRCPHYVACGSLPAGSLHR